MSTQVNQLKFDEIKRQSPLINFGDAKYLVDAGDAIKITEEPFVHQYVIRVKLDNAALIESTAKLLGVSLPSKMNHVEANKDLLICMISPDEWLVIDRSEIALKTIKALTDLYANEFAMVSDITGGQTMLHLTGTKVRDVLAKGMMFDTHPSVFGLGQCGQVVMAQAPLLLVPFANELGESQNFLLVIRRSFSDHIASWLIDASLEFSA